MLRFVFVKMILRLRGGGRVSEQPLPTSGQLPFSSAARSPYPPGPGPGSRLQADPHFVHMFFLHVVTPLGKLPQLLFLGLPLFSSLIVFLLR